MKNYVCSFLDIWLVPKISTTSTSSAVISVIKLIIVFKSNCWLYRRTIKEQEWANIFGKFSVTLILSKKMWRNRSISVLFVILFSVIVVKMKIPEASYAGQDDRATGDMIALDSQTIMVKDLIFGETTQVKISPQFQKQVSNDILFLSSWLAIWPPAPAAKLYRNRNSTPAECSPSSEGVALPVSNV